MQLNTKIVEAFLDNPLALLSIHQLAKKLEIPYGTAYNRIHLLAELGVVSIVPQGKAKLCSLVVSQPLTPALAGLAAAGAAAAAIAAGTPLAALLGRVRNLLIETGRGHLLAALLLNARDLPDTFDGIETLSLDFFVLAAENSSDHLNEAADLDARLIAVAPHLEVTSTRMVVTPSMLTGMLQERENEAGIGAFMMLRRGLLLYGFERFWDVVLRAFAR